MEEVPEEEGTKSDWGIQEGFSEEVFPELNPAG